jgi:hypothetical protein
MLHVRLLPLAIVILIAMTINGCGDNSSERVAQVALEGSKRQAALDQEMARLNQQVTEANRSLIESNGQSQRQVLALAQDVERQQGKLDQERRDLTRLRDRESLLAPVFLTIGTLAVCSLPLVLCWYLLRGLWRESSEAPVTQLLVDQLLLVDDALGLPNPSFERLLPSGSKAAISMASNPVQPSAENAHGQLGS